MSTVTMEVLRRTLPWIYEIKRRVNMFQIRKIERVTCVEGITEETMNEKSLTEYKKMIDETLIDEWQSAWNGNNKGGYA